MEANDLNAYNENLIANDKTFGEKIVILGHEIEGKKAIIKSLALDTPNNQKEIKKLQIGSNYN